MAQSRVAPRYVKSLLDLAVEHNAVDQVHNDMVMFTKVVDSNRDFKLMLSNPVIRHEKKREILEKIFRGKVHSLTMSIFDILTRKNREALLADIAREFHNAFNEYRGIRKAVVTTAVPLDQTLRTRFENMVKQYSDKKQVELIEKVDKEMIGGFILNIGDRQVDASIRSKMKSLKLEFSQNPYIKEY